MRLSTPLLALLLLVAAGCDSSDDAPATPDLAGTWEFAGQGGTIRYTVNESDGTVSGVAVFDFYDEDLADEVGGDITGSYDYPAVRLVVEAEPGEEGGDFVFEGDMSESGDIIRGEIRIEADALTYTLGDAMLVRQ